MIEISISRKLADAHPKFMAGCAGRGHQVDVFEEVTESSGPRASEGITGKADDAPGHAATVGVSRRGGR
jgi:hypothetical protein